MPSIAPPIAAPERARRGRARTARGGGEPSSWTTRLPKIASAGAVPRNPEPATSTGPAARHFVTSAAAPTDSREPHSSR